MCALLCAVMIVFAVSCSKKTEDNAERYEFFGMSVVLPDGFSATERAGIKMAVYKDYPAHSDNITFAESGDTLADYTQESVRAQYEALFGNIENYKYEQKKIAGTDAVVVEFGLSYYGVNIHETVYSYFLSGRTVSVTFASVTGEFDQAFQKAAESIKIAK